MEGVSASTSAHHSAERDVLPISSGRDGLSDYSPKDAKWDVYRAQTELTADLLAEYDEFQRYAARMADCSGVLLFGWETQPETGETRLRLKQARFCRCRHCATCAWRRTLAMTARFLEALPGLMRDHPKARWLFLTLTVPNCPIEELGETLKAMNAGWNRLRLRQEFKPVLGWGRSTEVTQEAKRTGYAHPHFHCLLMVPPSWFTRHYVKQSRWVELWRDCMRLDVDPVVDVRAIKGDVMGAAAETLKTFGYSVKPEQAAADPEWFLEMIRQVHRKRFFAAGGALKEAFKEPETDEEMIQGDQPADGLDDGSRLAFAWTPTQKRYRRAPKADRGPTA
jgi:plasmid rolling circle replication initiator protein Rep